MKSAEREATARTPGPFKLHNKNVNFLVSKIQIQFDLNWKADVMKEKQFLTAWTC